MALFFLLSLGFAEAALAGKEPAEVEDKEEPIPLKVRAMIAKTPPFSVEQGLTKKLGALGNDDKILVAFCATALAQKGEQYEKLIRLLHQELLTELPFLEQGEVRGLMPNFMGYLWIEEKRNVGIRCLEHDADSMSPEMLFRLFQIEEGALRTPANTYTWLTKAAEGGSVMAQYVLTRKILWWARTPATVPVALHAYMNIEAYHRFIRLAAEGGHRLAQMSLARFYLDRFPMHPENVEHINVAEGLRWLNILAGQRDDIDKRYKAISWVGDLYYVGSVGPHPVYPTLPGRRMPNEYTPNNTMEIAVDHAEALRWYMRIPENKRDCGVISALRDLYRLGLRVPVDLEKAEHYQSIFTTHCLKV